MSSDLATVSKMQFDVVLVDSPSLDYQPFLPMVNAGGVFAISVGAVRHGSQEVYSPFLHISAAFHRVYTYSRFRDSHSQLHMYHLATKSDSLLAPDEMSKEYVDQWLARRKLGELTYYSGKIHLGMFQGLETWIAKELSKRQIKPKVSGSNYAPYLTKNASLADYPKALWNIRGKSEIFEMTGVNTTNTTLSDLKTYLLDAFKLSHSVQVGNFSFARDMDQNTDKNETDGVEILYERIAVCSNIRGGDVCLGMYPKLQYAYLTVNSFNQYMSVDELAASVIGAIDPTVRSSQTAYLGNFPGKKQVSSYLFATDNYSMDPRVSSRVTKDHGRGHFAAEDIKKGSVIFHGEADLELKTEAEAFPDERPWQAAYSVHMTEQAEEGIFITPLRSDEDSSYFTNHACDPTLWWNGYDSLVARRDIAKGEELTYDYSTVELSKEMMFPNCGNCVGPTCRKQVKGDDWKLPELQEAYGNHWFPHILKKIKAKKNIMIMK